MTTTTQLEDLRLDLNNRIGYHDHPTNGHDTYHRGAITALEATLDILLDLEAGALSNNAYIHEAHKWIASAHNYATAGTRLTAAGSRSQQHLRGQADGYRYALGALTTHLAAALGLVAGTR